MTSAQVVVTLSITVKCMLPIFLDLVIKYENV